MRTRVVVIVMLLFTHLAQAQVESRQVPQVTEQLRKIYGVSEPSPGYSLAALLATQRRSWPQAWVSSTFYDWRTTSKYRRQAGLHLGYDIAMPHGSTVIAAWPGRVVSVAPWYGQEFGISVESADGTIATYGHVAPLVQVGDSVSSGDTLGTIASDHVDVKLRDPSGRYLAFGEGAGNPYALPSRDGILVAWLVARNGAELADEDLDRRRILSQRDRLERTQLKDRIPKLQSTYESMREYQRKGLVSLARVEKSHTELKIARRRLSELEQHGSLPVEALEQRGRAARTRLEQIQSYARAQGYDWSDVERLVQTAIRKDKKLEAQVKEYKQTHGQTRAARVEQLREQVLQGRSRLKTLKELHQMGGLSDREFESARQQHQLLEEELAGYLKHP